MEQIKVIKYKAEDGKIFDDETACLHYEHNLFLRNVLSQGCRAYTSDLEEIPIDLEGDWIEDATYILATDYHAKSAVNQLADECGFELPFATLDDNLTVLVWNSYECEWQDFGRMLEQFGNTYDFITNNI